MDVFLVLYPEAVVMVFDSEKKGAEKLWVELTVKSILTDSIKGRPHQNYKTFSSKIILTQVD